MNYNLTIFFNHYVVMLTLIKKKCSEKILIIYITYITTEEFNKLSTKKPFLKGLCTMLYTLSTWIIIQQQSYPQRQ